MFANIAVARHASQHLAYASPFAGGAFVGRRPERRRAEIITPRRHDSRSQDFQRRRRDAGNAESPYPSFTGGVA